MKNKNKDSFFLKVVHHKKTKHVHHFLFGSQIRAALSSFLIGVLMTLSLHSVFAAPGGTPPSGSVSPNFNGLTVTGATSTGSLTSGGAVTATGAVSGASFVGKSASFKDNGGTSRVIINGNNREMGILNTAGTGGATINDNSLTITQNGSTVADITGSASGGQILLSDNSGGVSMRMVGDTASFVGKIFYAGSNSLPSNAKAILDGSGSTGNLTLKNSLSNNTIILDGDSHSIVLKDTAGSNVLNLDAKNKEIGADTMDMVAKGIGAEQIVGLLVQGLTLDVLKNNGTEGVKIIGETGDISSIGGDFSMKAPYQVFGAYRDVLKYVAPLATDPQWQGGTITLGDMQGSELIKLTTRDAERKLEFGPSSQPSLVLDGALLMPSILLDGNWVGQNPLKIYSSTVNAIENVDTIKPNGTKIEIDGDLDVTGNLNVTGSGGGGFTCTDHDGWGLDCVGEVLRVTSSQVQARVATACPAGQSIRAIDVNGGVTCEVDDNTDTNTWPPSTWYGAYYRCSGDTYLNGNGSCVSPSTILSNASGLTTTTKHYASKAYSLSQGATTYHTSYCPSGTHITGCSAWVTGTGASQGSNPETNGACTGKVIGVMSGTSTGTLYIEMLCAS